MNAWHVTYGLPTIITNCSNNYGPYQANEKFIPTILNAALDNVKIPVYGNGNQIRDWLFVEDHVTALMSLLSEGRIGERYNIGGDVELENIQMVNLLLERLSKRLGTDIKNFLKLI